MAWIGPLEAAKRLGISVQALRKKLPVLADEGVARRDGNKWRIRSEGLEVAYDDVTRRRSDSPRVKKAEAAGDVAPPPAATRQAIIGQIDAVKDDADISRSEADRQIAILKKRLLSLDVAEREGTLVDAEKARKAFYEAGRRVRDLILGLPVRISADLAAEGDPATVSIILERELVSCLEGLSGAE